MDLKSQRIKGIQITSFTHDKAAVNGHIAALEPGNAAWSYFYVQLRVYLAWQTFMLVWRSFPPRRLTMDLKRHFHSKKTTEIFLNYKLIKQTNSQTHFFFSLLYILLLNRKTKKNKTLMCRKRWFSGVNNLFWRSLSRPEAHPTVTWICRGAVGPVVKARASLGSNKSLPGYFSVFQEPSVTQQCQQSQTVLPFNKTKSRLE